MWHAERLEELASLERREKREGWEVFAPAIDAGISAIRENDVLRAEVARLRAEVAHFATRAKLTDGQKETS